MSIIRGSFREGQPPIAQQANEPTLCYWPKAAPLRPAHFPVPVSDTVCGLLLALSFTFMVAERAPVAPGLKVTEIVHLPFAGTLEPQVFVGEAKSPGSAPLNVTVNGNAVDKLLVSFRVLAALGVPPFCGVKAGEVVDTTACATPVPVSATLCGLPAASSVSTSSA